MTDEAERKSYAEKTNMQGFDQIVAMTEDNINASFEFRHGRDAAKGPFRKFYVDIEDEGTIDVDMDAPTIHFIHEPFQAPEDPPNVYFHLHLRSGKLTYWTGRGRSSVLHEVPVKGWTLSFAVRLDVEKLAKTPPEILAKVKNLGVYSVSQLLFNFTNPYISDFDPKHSITPGFDLRPGENINADSALRNFLMLYLKVMTKEGRNVFGYSVVVDTPKVNPVATFPPTDVKFQTMRHHVGGGAIPEARSGKSLFLFLQMVDNRPMLTKPLMFSGNLVAGKAVGTMAISKELMWDRYLFPKLARVNLQAIQMLNKIIHWTMSGLDNVDITKSSYKWLLTKPEPGEADSKWTKFVNKGADFEWDGFGLLVEKEAGDNYKHSMTSRVETSVRWSAGSNVITITGKSNVEEQSAIRGGKTPAHITRPVLEWGVNLTLNSVKDGGLEVVVQNQRDKPKCTCEAATHYGLFSLLFGESKRDELSETLKQVIQKGIEREKIADDIAALVNGQNNFVFPGGGTLFFCDPIFNERGDLLVGLNIKQ